MDTATATTAAADQSLWQAIMYCMIGVGLASSCGFRVFVPMLVMGIAVRGGTLQLSEGWHWMGSLPALGMFGLATFYEVAGYCIPWLDNVLDTVASPAAVVAGIVATAGCVSRWNDPAAQWAVAIIAGGPAAGLIQTGTVLVRGTSTTTTGGLFNFVESMVELFLSVVISVLGWAFLCLAIAAGGFLLVRRMLRKRRAAQVTIGAVT